MDRPREEAAKEPFWEREYADPAMDAFGGPAVEILDLIDRLPERARVLDLGCGAGRNALPLARAGCRVTAVDRSTAGITRLRDVAAAERLPVEALVADLAEYRHRGAYDLVIAHGVLHLLPRPGAIATVAAMKAATVRGGWNVVAVFTDALPQPPDLEAFVLTPFSTGELLGLYADWQAEQAESCVLEDEHSGGIRHRHAIDRIVTRRPLASQMPRGRGDGPPICLGIGGIL